MEKGSVSQPWLHCTQLRHFKKYWCVNAPWEILIGLEYIVGIGRCTHSPGDCNVQPRLRSSDLGGGHYPFIENHWSRSAVFKLKFVSESPGEHAENEYRRLECGSRTYFRNKFPGDALVADSRATLSGPWMQTVLTGKNYCYTVALTTSEGKTLGRDKYIRCKI